MLSKPVDFSTAKLLKEKGFEMTAGSCYYNKEFFINQNLIPLQYPELKGERYKERVTDKIVFTPTIAEVIDWCLEKHGIWIWVERYSTLFRPYAEEIDNERFGKWEGHKHDLPTKAYEATIEYILTKIL
jgi:hypothetical protein